MDTIHRFWGVDRIFGVGAGVHADCWNNAFRVLCCKGSCDVESVLALIWLYNVMGLTGFYGYFRVC